MNTQNRCPQCGQPISQGVKGLCPNCLALVAFGPDETAARTIISNGNRADATDPNLPEARPLLSGSARYFGDYELIEEIARGGMGVVFKARQTSLNRLVAVKMILGGHLATEADVKRFRTEAEAAANLQHPNIVAIHETGEHEGRHYFSMDYVEGRNLAQVLDGKPMAPAQAAALLKTIAEAVHFAHQRGTLHRDLKPHNILIDASGQPRITDFGLAKRIERTSDVTHTGTVMGSPSYMPPEQATGRHSEVGPASDVYSLGAILYHLLTGRAPFAADSPIAALRKVVEEDPVAPSKLNVETPPDLETICLKCLEKRPERRYHSARELAEELSRFQNREPILARPAGAWRKLSAWWTRNPWALIGAGAVAGILLVGVAFGLWERVQYLEGGVPPKFYDPVPYPMMVAFYFVLFPAMILGRWMKGRRQRGLQVSKYHIAILTGAGLLLVAFGLWSDAMYIRLYVWKRPLLGTLPAYDSLLAVATFCLGMPLMVCWAGGVLTWQAIQRQQAHWSGSVIAEQEWLPRQSVHYSSGAFIAVTGLNLALFGLIAYFGIATGLFERVLKATVNSPQARIVLVTCFIQVAFTVSIACWVYATRRVYQRPLLVQVFLVAVLAGAVLGWFFGPIPLQPGVIVSAILTGLLGGRLMVKWIKIRTEKPMEPLAPLVLGDLFDWDRRAFMLALTAALMGLGMIATWLPRHDVEAVLFFPFFATWTALWPLTFLAVRISTGRLREFFRSVLVLVSFGLVGPILAVLTDTNPNPNIGWLASIPVGLLMGYALICFGKIRPKSAHSLSA